MKTLVRYFPALIVWLPISAFAAPHVDTPGSAPEKPLVSISAPAGLDRVRISISIVSYPGVPERASCRMLFKAVNESSARVELSAQLHTFDTYKSDLNSWLVPTGSMAPGQSIERTYSCRSPSFVALDQSSDYGWPRTCIVNGESQSPCRMPLKVDFNLPQHTP